MIVVKITVNGGREKCPYCGLPNCIGMVCVILAAYFTLRQTAQRFI